MVYPIVRSDQVRDFKLLVERTATPADVGALPLAGGNDGPDHISSLKSIMCLLSGAVTDGNAVQHLSRGIHGCRIDQGRLLPFAHPRQDFGAPLAKLGWLNRNRSLLG